MNFRLALLFFLLFSSITFSAVIVVDDTSGGLVNSNGLCSITEAIVAANTDAVVDSCAAGESGSDTIELSVNIVLTEQYENIDNGHPGDPGRTGTPGITSIITIDGMGHTLERDDSLACNEDSVSDSGEFRLIRIDSDGYLVIYNMVLKNGCVDADIGRIKFYGGGILNEGVLNIDKSKVSLNKANSGGGIYNSGLIETITNTTFYGNDSNAINNIQTGEIILLMNNTFSVNMARYYGAGISNRGVITSINNNTFYGNIGNGSISGNSSGAIFNQSDSGFYPGTISSMSNSLFINNTSPTSTQDCYNDTGTFNGNNNMSDNPSGGCPGLLATTLMSSSVGLLRDNGCVTALADGSCIQTHALLETSEAIDIADSGTDRDQRGFAHDGMRDIGAFEYLTGAERCVSLGMDTSSEFSNTVISAHELNQSIFCANLNTSTTDTISFAADIILTEVIDDDATFGHTGTRVINSPVVVDGAGYKLMRDSSLACNSDDIANDSEFRLLRVDSSGDLQLKNILLRSGCVDGAFNEEKFYGGAIYNSGALAITKTAILVNKANRGGGVFNAGTLSTLRNSTFYNNDSVSGGGAFFNDATVTTMRNNTYSENDSGNAAGGALANSGTIDTIKNNTFSSNSNSSSGAAIANVVSGSISSLENSLFHNNTSSSGNDDCFNDGSTFSGSNNMSDNIAGGCPGLRLTPLTPSTLGVLQDNGCTTLLANGSCIQTHALLAGSEAIDEGDASATTQDQRSFLANGIRDIGAFEYEGINDLIFMDGFE